MQITSKSVVSRLLILILCFAGAQAFAQDVPPPSSLLDWSYPTLPASTPRGGGEYIWASPNGSSSGTGGSESSPVSLQRATALAGAGDVVYLLPGTYASPWEVSGLKGTSSAPIVFRSAPGRARKALIRYSGQGGFIARLKNVSHITVAELSFDGIGSAVWGIGTGRLYKGDPNTGAIDNVDFIGNEIYGVEKEYGLNVSLARDVSVIGNYIHDIGEPAVARGEGIYVGCGNCDPAINTSQGVLIEGNRIERTGAEAIDVKTGPTDILIDGNFAYDTGFNLLTNGGQGNCCFGAAITVAAGLGGPDKADNFVVSNNRVGRSTGSGIGLGSGNGTIANNLVWETGFSVTDTVKTPGPQEAFTLFSLFEEPFKNVALTDNHVFAAAEALNTADDYGIGGGQPANVTSNEITEHASIDAAFTAWSAEVAPPGGGNRCELIVASDDDGNVASNTVDGDLSTRWSAQGDGQYIQYCLASARSLQSVSIAFYLGDQRSAIFDVSVSVDGNDWVDVLTQRSSSGTTLELETYVVDFIALAKYIRITGRGNTNNDWNSLTEVKLSVD